MGFFFFFCRCWSFTWIAIFGANLLWRVSVSTGEPRPGPSADVCIQHPLLILSCGGAWGRSAGAWDDAKALWKLPDRRRFLPGLLGNRSLAIQAVEPSGVFNWCGHSLIAGPVKGTGALWDRIHLRLNLSSGFCRQAISQTLTLLSCRANAA